MPTARSPAPAAAARPAWCAKPTAAPCSWTRSATCRSRCRPSCSGCWPTGPPLNSRRTPGRGGRPPLPDRADLKVIARRVLADVAPDSAIDPEALEHLAACRWPGNIRELRNVLTRLAREQPGQPITLAMAAATGGHAAPRTGAVRDSLRDTVKGRILAAHRDTGGNLSETARRLGVSRNTVYRAIAVR